VPTTAKPRKTGSRSSSKNGGAPKKASASRATTSHSRARESNPIADKMSAITRQVHADAGTVAKGAAAATVGTAMAALAGRTLIANRRRKRVLGVPMPRKPTIAKKNLAKQVASMAGDIEQKSLDLSNLSAKAKQAAKVFS